MSSEFDSLLNSIAAAAPRSNSGNWIQGEGVFDVELLSTTRKMGWNKTFTVRDKELFIVEFRILSVSSADPNVQRAHVVGSTASWTCKNPKSDGAADVKAFVIAVTGTDPRTVSSQDAGAQTQAALLALAAFGEAEAFKRLDLPTNFFVGRRVRLETKMRQTKTRESFTKHTWSPAPTG